MLEKLAAIKDRYIYLEEQLSDPTMVSDMQRFMKVNKEYRKLGIIVEALETYKALLDNEQQCNDILYEERDPEMRELARAELATIAEQRQPLEERIRELLTPKDPEDEKNVTLEIRSGTGGDEASIFAGDLWRMYQRYIEKQGWKIELMYENEGSAGGYDKIVASITGEDVYGVLKYESGVHRVQRVPKTESQGRVHTSAASVAVMPILELEDVEINPADLRIDTYRASGAGGQHVNKTESAVRITHLPTGTVSESQEARSQIKNREIAMNRLLAEINDNRKREQDALITERRRSLVSTGDRSAKIRTYNYPQNRVSDHRIGLTSYNLSGFMDGDIQEFIDSLKVAENSGKLAEGTAAED